jgi:O-antigen ligase
VLVFAAFGVLQSIALPGFAQLVYPDAQVAYDWDAQGRRLVSTMLDPNFAGALIMMILLVNLARIAFGTRVAAWKPGLLLLALALTVSRSSALAFLLGLAVILAVKGPSKRVLRIMSVAGVVVLPAIPFLVVYAASLGKLTVDASALARVFSWLRALQIFADNPLIGVGFNTYGFVQRYYGFEVGGASSFGLDGGILFIAVTTGVIGLTLYLSMVVLVLVRCQFVWRDRGNSAEDRGLALGCAAATLALLLHSLFVNSIVYPFLVEALWILWALSRPSRTAARPFRDESGSAAGRRLLTVSAG